MISDVPSSSSPRGIRQSNTIAALQALFNHGQLSRAELARHLGLNRSSSGHIVSDLAANSLVREVTQEEQKRHGHTHSGRPGILLELVPQAAIFIGAEIGVEHITTLRINLAAEIADCRVMPFDGKSVSVADAVTQATEQALRGLGKSDLESIEGFGLAAPAQIDRNGHVRTARLLGWKDVDLAKITRDSLQIDVPIIIENEANAFALGESYKNPTRKCGVTLFLVLETGVGGGILIDGQLLRGAHGLAGEIGHVHVRNGQELEQLLGLEQILEKYSQATGKEEITFDDFLSDVRDRSLTAVTIAEDWARDLAIAVVAVSRLIDPDRVVLGGSVAALYPMVAARVSHYIETRQSLMFPTPKIFVHDAAETGAAFGAACMLHRRFLSTEYQPVDNGVMTAQASSEQVVAPGKTFRR